MPQHVMPGLPDCSVTFPDAPENGIPLRKYSDEIVQDSDLLPFYRLHRFPAISRTVCTYSVLFMNSNIITQTKPNCKFFAAILHYLQFYALPSAFLSAR